MNTENILLDEKNMRYNFCPNCGGKLSIKETNSLSQLKCIDCGKIFYQNPAVGVAAILIKDKNIELAFPTDNLIILELREKGLID